MAASKHICYKPQCSPACLGLAQACPNQSVLIVISHLFVSIAGAAVALGVLFAISFMTLAICCLVLVCFCCRSRKMKYSSLPTSWAAIMYSIWYRITFLSCTCVAAVKHAWYFILTWLWSVILYDCVVHWLAVHIALFAIGALTVELILHVIALWTRRMVPLQQVQYDKHRAYDTVWVS